MSKSSNIGGPLRVLLDAFARSRFADLEVSDGQRTVRVRRRQGFPASSTWPAASELAARAGASSARSGMSTAQAAELDLEGAKTLKSPRVGIFLPPPNAAPPRAGVKLNQGDVYGIIESMNLKYEVRVEESGEIEAVLVDPGEPVEFGQPLVKLRQ